jgi:hypothetical protein
VPSSRPETTPSDARRLLDADEDGQHLVVVLDAERDDRRESRGGLGDANPLDVCVHTVGR